MLLHYRAGGMVDERGLPAAKSSILLSNMCGPSFILDDLSNCQDKNLNDCCCNNVFFTQCSTLNHSSVYILTNFFKPFKSRIFYSTRPSWIVSTSHSYLKHYAHIHMSFCIFKSCLMDYKFVEVQIFFPFFVLDFQLLIKT